jgi:rhodanese-related sulfurtransferase
VAQILTENGFKNARALKGGWDAWTAAGGQVEPKEKISSR